jgi:hypothetical protein
MRQFMMTMMALAALGATVATAQAEDQTRSPQDLGNDFSHPGRVGGFSQLPDTCTGLKSSCINGRMATYRGRRVYFGAIRERRGPRAEKFCTFRWEQCMKTGWWEGYLVHRQAERR